jgi:hypothetical protein
VSFTSFVLWIIGKPPDLGRSSAGIPEGSIQKTNGNPSETKL